MPLYDACSKCRRLHDRGVAECGQRTIEGVVRYLPLHMNVIAVAMCGAIGDWAAYIGPVAGYRHDWEWQGVAESGDKLPKKIAVAMFPELAESEYRS